MLRQHSTLCHYFQNTQDPNSNSHGARPVHLIITMIKWFRTSRLSINLSVQALERIPGLKEAATPKLLHEAATLYAEMVGANAAPAAKALCGYLGAKGT